jgi:hypothetical protein
VPVEVSVIKVHMRGGVGGGRGEWGLKETPGDKVGINEVVQIVVFDFSFLSCSSR